MSRIKILKAMPDHNMNVIDILSIILPNEKAVYIETLLRLMKGTKDYESINGEIRSHLNIAYDISKENVDSIPDFHLLFYYKFLESVFNRDDIRTYQRFCELNERKLIDNPDLTTYSSYEQIMQAVSAAELKLDMKELEKQTVKIFEDETFLVVKPLTYLSSKKYGSNTKWCTTSNNDYSYFQKYAGNGILIYIINKTSGKKCACYYSLKSSDKEFSFWNQMDVRVDSMECELPEEISSVIRNEITNVRKTNRSYLTKEEIRKDDDLNMERSMSKSLSPSVVETRAERPTEDMVNGDMEESADMAVETREQPIYNEAQAPATERMYSGEMATGYRNPAESGISSMRNGEGI